MRNKISTLLVLALGMGAISCKKETPITEDPLVVPENYVFDRNGQTSVSYSGQTERLNQLSEITAVLKTADGGTTVSEDDLIAMYENTGGDGNGNFSFSSTKQLKNKTFDLDQEYFSQILKDAALVSADGTAGIQAANGTAGLITRGGNGKTILVDENGFEFTQIFEKGLMGGVMYYQILNVYLTDAKLGPAVDNENIVENKNYTSMEHHWDEAFGYYGAPTDFKSDYQGPGSIGFWAKYSDKFDNTIGQFNNEGMDTYKAGRAAIVAKRYDLMNVKVDDMNVYLGRVAAAAAIHYANEAKALTDQGDILHVLSESFAFVRALRFSNPDNREMSPSQVDALLASTFGGNLWTVTTSDLDNFINDLSSAFGLEAVKDIL